MNGGEAAGKDEQRDRRCEDLEGEFRARSNHTQTHGRPFGLGPSNSLRARTCDERG